MYRGVRGRVCIVGTKEFTFLTYDDVDRTLHVNNLKLRLTNYDEINKSCENRTVLLSSHLSMACFIQLIPLLILSKMSEMCNSLYLFYQKLTETNVWS